MNKAIILLALVFAGSPASAAEERAATKAEIEKIAVGKTVNGRMTYGKDGSYAYAGGGKGKYTISAGKICVKFTGGGSRCDRIVTDGKTYTLINQKGERYPYGR
ncbi:hypothetical protein LRX75_19270 [Rhizobium sp. DKSPLA3]|uniref:DUF995 domain-containing protein n=1 Tax=Rhizobium quercicola TaxID=2901226 RepID=A0A9X1NWF8_9HYPH|nr:hypothetical protein [Rhizobium quercicola]MCD7111181.1 hypothetical protein [Rhizobium quercicola]